MGCTSSTEVSNLYEETRGVCGKQVTIEVNLPRHRSYSLAAANVLFFLYPRLTNFYFHKVTTDPYTGQKKVKKRLGGAYPGQKIPQHGPYVPPASAFGKDGQATAHFVTHGGGNALTLVQCDGSTAPQVGGSVSPPQMIQGRRRREYCTGKQFGWRALYILLRLIFLLTDFFPARNLYFLSITSSDATRWSFFRPNYPCSGS
jgi:hypothetical protein